jgi:uncharacterized membrane protein YgdD (TMEM256/DUF423 family)
MALSNRPILILAALNGLMGVVLGAMAAHGVGDPHAKDLIHTGSIYQLLHAAAAMAVLSRSRWAALLMSVGALLFAGSIYLLALAVDPSQTLGLIVALRHATGVIGPITPLGGLLMIAGWAVLLVTAFRSPEGAGRERP